MGKIGFVYAIILATFLSCTNDGVDSNDIKDSEEVVLNNSNIVGNWESTYWKVFVLPRHTLQEEGPLLGFGIKFFEDKKCIYNTKYAEYTEYGTYELLGTDLDIFIKNSLNNTKRYNYKIGDFEKDKMTLTERVDYLENGKQVEIERVYTMKRLDDSLSQ